MGEFVMAKVSYICSRAPSLKIKIGETTYSAANGVLVLEEDVAEALETMMETRPDIRGILRKINMQAAELQVKKHQAAQGPQAVKGPFSSVNPATEAVRLAREANMPENLTGKAGAVNTNANPPAAPVDVQEIKPQVTGAGSILDRMKNGTEPVT